MYHVGEPVVYRVAKFTGHPGPRAKNISPTPKGEYYSYEVNKFWVVADVRDDGKLLLRTRRGKEHIVNPDDPKLRKVTWWERLTSGRRFPRITKTDG
jgi:hypothetical protein